MSDKMACVDCTRGNNCKLKCPECGKHNSTYPMLDGRTCSTCKILWHIH